MQTNTTKPATQAEKAAIRAHWAWLRLRFTSGGEVMAQKAKGGAWGVLLTPSQLRDTLNALRDGGK